MVLLIMGVMARTASPGLPGQGAQNVGTSLRSAPCRCGEPSGRARLSELALTGGGNSKPGTLDQGPALGSVIKRDSLHAGRFVLASSAL